MTKVGQDAQNGGGAALGERLGAVSARCVCLHSRMTARTLTRAFDQALQPLGLESTQFTLLAAMIANPGASVTALADRLALERSSLSRNLALLERRGLVTALDGPGRAVRHAVTGEGAALVEAAIPHWEALQTRFEAALAEAGGWESAQGAMRKLRHAATPRPGTEGATGKS